MTEDTIFINTNAAYHVCRNNVQYQYENLSKNRNKESVPIEVDSEAGTQVPVQTYSRV